MCHLPPGLDCCFLRTLRSHSYLTQSVYNVVLQKSNPTQMTLILYISYNKGRVDGFVLELTSEERLYERFLL